MQSKDLLHSILAAFTVALLFICLSGKPVCYAQDLQVRIPSFTPFVLFPLLPGLERQIPQSNISLKTTQVPKWKEVWDQAREAAQQNDLSSSASLYDELLSMKENLITARWELVSVLIQLESYNKASSHLDVLLDSDGNNERYAFMQAILVQKEGQFERSLELFSRLAGSSLAETHTVLAGQANALFAMNDEKGCLDVLKKMLLKKPEDLEVGANFAILAYRLKEYELAWPYLEKMLDAEPNSDGATLMAARLLGQLDKSAQAAPYWLRIAETYPANYEANTFLARYFEWQGEPEKALQYLLLMQRQIASNAQLKRIGVAQLSLGRYLEARATFEELLAKQPNDKDTARSLILIHVALEQKEETLDALEYYFSIESQPDRENLRQAAELYDERGFYEEAIPIYRRLLALSPNEPGLLWALAENLLVTGQDEDSLKIWKKLADVSPGVVEVYRPMAQLLKRLGRKNELLPVLEVIHELDPGDLEIIFLLAELYFERNDDLACGAMLALFDEEMRTSSQFFKWRGSIRQRSGDLQGALTDFENLLVMGGGDGALRIRCVRLAGQIGDLHSLERHSIFIQEHFADFSADDLLALADAFLSSRDFEKARQMYRRALLKLSNSDPREKRISELEQTVYLGIAQSLLNDNRPYEAEQVLRQALSQVTGSGGEIISLLFHLASSSGRVEDARQWLARAANKTAKGEWAVRLMVAQLAALIGDDRDAAEKARSLTMDFAGLVKDLGKANYFFEWKKSGARLAAFLISLDRLPLAEKICREIINKDAEDKEAHVLLGLIYLHSEGLWGVKFASDATAFGFATIREYAVFLHRYKMADELLAYCRYASGKVPDSLWARGLWAEALMMKGSWSEAREILEAISRDYPENCSIQIKLARIAFREGRFEEAERLCAAVKDSSRRIEALELQARILWMKHEWPEAVALYEEFLTPTVDQILQAKAVDYGLVLPLPEDRRSFWDIVSFVPNEGNSISAKVMRPLFFEGLDGPRWQAIEMLSAQQYARYRWQDKFAEELKARRSVQRHEYFLAARQYERFSSRYPEDDSVLYDLAGVYSRLGRLADEAALYEELQDKQISYPDLADNIERIRLKQRPYTALVVGYDNQEGRNSYINMEQNWQGLKAWYSFRSQTEMSFAVERYNYRISDLDLRANRFTGSYTIRLSQGVSSFVSIGLHTISGAKADTVLLGGGIEGKIGDKLSGSISVSRDIVDDTVASLTRTIVRESFEAGFSFDLLPKLEVGGDYIYSGYSDNNWTTGYDLRSSYTIFPEPTFFQLRYVYDFKESLDGAEAGGAMTEGFAAADHPYWSPKNYWQNNFGLFFKHTLGKNVLDRGTPRYYTIEYYFGHDSDGYPLQKAKGTLFAELTPTIFIKGAFEVATSEQFRQKQVSISASYRW